jgi:GNAT superfamily N-acetyltransferase
VIFASKELGARIEAAECRLIVEGAEAIRRRRPDAGVFIEQLAGGVVTYTGEGSPLGKVAGLGFGGVPDEGRLAEIEGMYAQRRCAVQVELSILADPAIGAMLTRRGYVLIGFENVLGLGLPGGPASRAGDEIVVKRCDERDLETWIDVTLSSFDTPDTQGVPSHESTQRKVLEEIMRDMAAATGFIRYLAYRGSTPAGGCSMRMCSGIAQLCGAGTLPEHRRRGGQSAMLAVRLKEAADAGCDIAVVTTLPGSKSHENVQKQGFELLYTRAILVKDISDDSKLGRG